MNTTHPDILEAERNGLPEGKPETRECVICGDIKEAEAVTTCAACGEAVCKACRLDILDKDFCGQWCADGHIRKEFLLLEDKNRKMKADFVEIGQFIDVVWQTIDVLKLPLGSCQLIGRIKGKCNWWSK